MLCNHHLYLVPKHSRPKRESRTVKLSLPTPSLSQPRAPTDLRLTSAQVMISRFVSSSTTSGSVLTAQSLVPALDSVSPSLCPFPAHALSLRK